MNKEALIKMTNDPDCIKVASALFQIIAYCETIRGIIAPKQQELVDKYQFKVADKYKKVEEDKIIKKPEHLYLVSDDDFEIYLDEMDKFHTEKGFKKPSREHCPLLIAEDDVRKVKQQVAEFLEPYTGISYDMVSGSLESYRKYFDLIMGLFAGKVKAIV